ncbi:PAS domain-containing sensor histidine kinase, partial [Pseudidiomarina aestuarii]
MLFRGIILAVSVAFVAFVYVLLQVMAKAGLDARIMWIIGSMVTGVAIVAVAALSLSARWRSSADRDLAPLLSGLSHSDIGVALIDAYGRTLYANPAFPRKLGIEPGEDMLAALEARLSYLDVGSSELADLRTRAMRGEAGEIYVDFSQAKKREQLALAAPSDTAADDAERNSDTAIDDASAENIVEEAYDAGTVCLRISVTAANARAGQMLWTVDGIDPSAMPEAGRSLVVVEQSAAFGAFVTGSDDEMTVGGVASRMADGAGSEQADQMIERLPVGVCGLDEEGRILYLNRRLANWLGGEPQDFASGTLELADLIVGDGMNGEVKLKVKGGEPIKCFVTHSINAPGTGPIRSQAVVFP